MDSFFYSRIHFEFTICDANLLETCSLSREFTIVHYLLRKFTMNWLSLSRSHYESIIVFPSIIASLWIRYLFVEFDIDSLSVTRIHYGSISFTRTHNEFTIKYSNSVWVRYLFREIPINSLSSSWIGFDFTIKFANSLWILYQLREFTINPLSFLR